MADDSPDECTHATRNMDYQYDYILVGAGLANGLIAMAILDRRPNTRIVVIDRAARPGGNHTWCFHMNDIPDSMESIVAPLVGNRWPRYEVRFPGRSRTLAAPYACATSESFSQALLSTLAGARNGHFIAESEVRSAGEHHVQLMNGNRLTGVAVLDGRGPSSSSVDAASGYQKFLGIEVELQSPHDVECPVVMDATIPQIDGFSFLYILPFSPTRLLVEETSFSQSPKLHVEATRMRLLTEMAERGWNIAESVREEAGVLPMPYGDLPAADLSAPLRVGYSGGWFHPATGYSFPIAARVADVISALPAGDITGPSLHGLRRRHDEQARFARFLNRMLFTCFEQDRMWNVFDRFYRLPESLIHRFYAMELTGMDRARILFGRPPRGIRLKDALFAIRRPH